MHLNERFSLIFLKKTAETMASSTQSLPVSQILKSKTEIEDEPNKKKSREDWRKAKELEEARKAGTAPAAVDEEGKDINPHIPQYIASAPWYYGTSGPTLKHQRPQEDKQKSFSDLDEWYKRGVDTVSFIFFLYNCFDTYLFVDKSDYKIQKGGLRELWGVDTQTQRLHGTSPKSGG